MSNYSLTLAVRVLKSLEEAKNVMAESAHQDMLLVEHRIDQQTYRPTIVVAIMTFQKRPAENLLDVCPLSGGFFYEVPLGVASDSGILTRILETHHRLYDI